MRVKQQIVMYWNDTIRWIFNKRWHRDVDLPAVYNFIDGKLYSISYCQHYRYHRTTGPAVIHYEVKKKYYFYQGRRYGNLEEMQMVEACK